MASRGADQGSLSNKPGKQLRQHLGLQLKVRFSDEGTLLFRWNGQDIPFYAFQEDKPYITPEFPVLQNENLPVEYTIGRGFFRALS